MKAWINRLRAAGITAIAPQWLRSLGYRMLGGDRLDRELWQMEHDRVVGQARRIPVNPALEPVGIVRDIMGKHAHYEAACLELGVPFRLIDITGEDWQEQVTHAGCRVWLVRPFVLTPDGKALYDERVGRLADEPGMTVFPDVLALRLYESKHRTTAWLKQHGIPQPDTHVFTGQEAAMAYLQNADFPLVFKTDLGSEALGVRILRGRDAAADVVRQCFGAGYRLPGRMASVRQQGAVLLQAYVADAREWRMVRIGNSFFGHRKGKQGDFHSGSKIIEFDTPPDRLLDFTFELTEKGRFRSMAVDILETPAGDLKVIELHAYFGCNSPHVMAVNGVPGRFVRVGPRWVFEAGDFNRNNSCNLRVQWVMGRG